KVIDLHPWEYNEVIPCLVAALKQDYAPIIALHLTRPSIPIPDRVALGIPSHLDAARGAYVLREYRSGAKMGTLIVQGTSVISNLIPILKKLDTEGLNIKIVAAISPELFRLQSKEYQFQVLSEADRADSTFFANRAKRTMWNWTFNPLACEYSLTPDFDDQWRTGGSLEEIVAESHLSSDHLLAGIRRFAIERKQRLTRLQNQIQSALGLT
ncbi:MAG: transketolase, partial [Planctomycetota bacterium]